jgi:carboxyl-terminal processing protease
MAPPRGIPSRRCHFSSLARMTMFRALRVAAILLLIVGASCSHPHADENPELTGDHVANITRMFLRSHYSQQGFDDTHSQEMLKEYEERFDPGHYYFQQGDIADFKRFGGQLDDQIRRGNIDVAFLVYNRFLERVREREQFLNTLLHEHFDLTKDDTFIVDRRNAPYPKDRAQAEALFRNRVKRELLELTLRGQTQDEAKDALRKRYRSLHFRYEHFTHNDVVTAFLNAFTAAYDPHSSYMSPDDLENFNISMRLSLEGIGATLRWEDGYTVISSIIPGGAAAREGTLQPEDKIVAVGEGKDGPMEDVSNVRLIDVVKLIRGERGTLVRVAFLRKGKGVAPVHGEASIVRDKIVLTEGEAKGDVEPMPVSWRPQPLRIGVINLPSFYVDFSQRNSNPADFKSASRDVERILEHFREAGVDGVILDLRNNGGGGLDEAVSLAGLFLRRGPILMVKDVRGHISRINNPHSEPLYQGPLLVLVNRYSASASEIVAGALQDYGRAVLVGDRATFGKGTVQNIITLPQGLGALKATVAKFYRPGSASTQNRGVEPDIVLPSMNSYLDIGESSLDNALPWDTVEPASFKPWSDLDSVLPVLRARSHDRTAKDPYFVEVSKEVQDYVRNRKDRKTITLKQLVEEVKADQKEAAAAAKDSAHAKGPADPGAKVADPRLIEAEHILTDYIQLQAGASRAVATGRS